MPATAHLAGQVGGGDPHVVVAEVDREQHTVRQYGREHQRGAAAARARPLRHTGSLDQRSGVDQLGHQARHRTARQLGQVGDLRPGQGSVLAHHVEHSTQIGLPRAHRHTVAGYTALLQVLF
jgi:hypothetical protein